MKTKLILIAALAATLGGAAGWLAPHQLASASTAASDRKILYYACPMHPTIKYDKPGDCPICGMNLVPVYADETKTNAPAATPAGCCSAGTNP
jgi:Cu(I)/Ag(I) efflux system membrane fusion protein